MIHVLNRITEHLLVDKWADCFRCSDASNAVPGRRQLATAGRSDISRVASAYAFLVQPPIRDRSPGSTVVAPLDAKDLQRLANAHALWIYDGARRTRTADLLVRSVIISTTTAYGLVEPEPVLTVLLRLHSLAARGSTGHQSARSAPRVTAANVDVKVGP